MNKFKLSTIVTIVAVSVGLWAWPVSADQTIIFSPSEATETQLKRYVFSDQVMFLERLIGDRDSFFIQAHDHDGQLMMVYHFGYGDSRMELKVLYKQRFGSDKAHRGFRSLLRMLRDPARISITDQDISQGIGLKVDRILE